jgi:hypothetical protein
VGIIHGIFNECDNLAQFERKADTQNLVKKPESEA